MKSYKTLKGFTITFFVLSIIAVAVTVLFYNINEWGFAANIITQLGQSITGEDFVLTNDIIFDCQKWGLIISVILLVLDFIFLCCTFGQAEKVIRSIKYRQKTVAQTYTNSPKDRRKMRKIQKEEKKMKTREEKRAAKLAKKEAKAKAKEQAAAAKQQKKEEKAVVKAAAKKPEAAPVQEAKPTAPRNSKEAYYNDILKNLK